MDIDGYELKLTCGACPEQYDVFLSGKQVDYLRLRHGYFTAGCPDHAIMSTTVYEANTIGDGTFDSTERDFHLTKAIRHIDRHLKSIDE